MIRPADTSSLDDARAVSAIYAPIVRDTVISFEADPPSPEEMLRRMRAALELAPWLVFEREGEVAGYAYAGPHRARKAYQWSAEVSVYVAESAHRGGVGRRLYAALLELIRRQGYCNAYAGITLPNDASVGFHEALDFERLGVFSRVGFKLGAWRDVGWWQLALRGDAEPPDAVTPFPAIRDEIDWKAY